MDADWDFSSPGGVLDLTKCSKNDILEVFLSCYNVYEGLFSAITEEKYFYTAPDRLRLPLIFYLGHTATLYINKMMLGGMIKDRVNYEFEKLFETGVDEMSWDDTENYRMGGAFKWPSIKEVMDYRHKVKEVVINVIKTTPLVLPILHDHPWWSLLMGIEHERAHFETSSVLIRQLPLEFLKRPHTWRYAPLTTPTSPINEMIAVDEGEVVLGKPWNFPTFGWDYEYGETKMWVPKFESSKYLVTNREYLEFVKEGGYSRREYWTDEGWEWVQFKQAKHPIFWTCHRRCRSGCGSELAEYSHCTLTPPSPDKEDYYKYRVMFDVLDMPLDWPVEVNYHEAKAYCVWKGPEYRLLTEAEHVRIRGEQPPSCKYDCDDPIRVTEGKYNNNLTFGSSTPVNYFPPNVYGFHDVYGNVYTWTEDHMNGLPGFKTNYLYDDMATSYFDGRHNMMLGGSWASCGDTSSRFSRWWFRRHFFQHAGFRLARSLTNQIIPVRLCQADHLYTNSTNTPPAVPLPVGRLDPLQLLQPLNPQFEFDRVSVCEDIVLETMDRNAEYGRSLISYCKEHLIKRNNPLKRAIVFGCGPGYTSFLLTAIFDQVVGVDYSGRLIAIANEFKDNGSITLTDKGSFHLPLQDGVDCNTNRTIFKQFTWIPNELEGFDFVLFESLERFNNPKGWLLKLHECVCPGCMVIVSSSDQWSWQVLSDYLMDRFVLIDEVTFPSAGNCVSSWVKVGDNYSLDPPA